MKATVKRWTGKNSEVRIYVDFPKYTIVKYVTGNQFHPAKSVESGFRDEAVTSKILSALFDSATKRYRTGTFEFDAQYNLIETVPTALAWQGTNDQDFDMSAHANLREVREMEAKDFRNRMVRDVND